jgi:hypothetical protein
MDDELRPEYDLSKLLKEGVRGKYVDRYREGHHAIVSGLEDHHAQVWDKQLEEDLEAGRLDTLLAEVEEDYEAELHWFEAHGIGRKDFKIKRVIR